jgi:histidinol-phosphate aminotransferase
MAFELSKKVRQHILSLKPYSSARDEYTGSVGVFLDANENSFGSVGGGEYNRYPDPLQKKVKAKLALIKGVSPDNIFMGNGSDEAIDLLIRLFCEPHQDNILITSPTYGMYAVSAETNAVAIRDVPLTDDFQLRPQEILKATDEHTKIMFLCSPNNPSANSLAVADILYLLDNFSGVVVLDEAYIDFSASQSFIRYLDKYPHLVVMQTFSKAWGLAALRVGTAYASPAIITLINKIKPPYNINQLTQEKVLVALENTDQRDAMVKQILAARTSLIEAIGKLSITAHVFPSDANFVLVRTKTDATKIYDYLVSQQIIVRNRSKVILCQDCLRITVGTPAENEALIAALSRL